MTLFLRVDDLLRIAERILGEPLLIRDVGLLESAAARPAASAFGEPAYPTLEEQGAALVHSVCTNHALVDGNKRLALGSLIVILGINGHRLTWSNDEAYGFIMAIAAGELIDVPTIGLRIREATDPI
ncbi:type II toxin-antitoxin system death-on-curing family toxin [Candidatus Neomicrothrix sp.]|uniref:type II toxin-antitoxin system death-on-curing family toxin n=1 Tax=Candidatus Neomicrothrix sp. TaxID=2719034 RepID=UPI00259A9E0C|nr:type II toxin-antitoxin system death-on-curing family toxin [Candidatus Microthrix sp.]HMS49199.1 type II toxin-antitoxin system death-on-curing family toxin [Candidatus Microthrix sp.]